MKKILTHLLKHLLFWVLALTFTNVNAQTATSFQTSLQNVVQTTDRTLEFDLYLLNTDQAQPMEMAAFEAGITLNPAIYAGGILTASIVAGTSTLTNTAQVPTSITYAAAQTIVKLASKAPPGTGNGSIISQVSPGTRIIRLKLTSTVPFAANTTSNFFLTPSTAANPSYPTQVAVYVGGLNTQLPVAMGVNAFVPENPALNPPMPPVAYAVTGSGSYVQGRPGLPVGLANSEIGTTYTLYKNSIAQVPTVAGTGAAISFGNQLAGIYTASGTSGNGTTSMTGSAQIAIVDFKTTLQNIVQTTDRTLEFDLYLLNLDQTQPLEMATYQAGITLNPAIYAGGTLTASVVAGTSTLINTAQVPTSTTYAAAQTIVKLAAKVPPGIGNGSIISQVGSGTLLIRMRLTSTVPFAANSTPDFFISPSTAMTPSYPTAVAVYSGGLNTQMPVTMGVNAFVLENPILNAPVAKTLDIKVFLEGAFDSGTGLMTTLLNSGALIPTSQPFTGAPWNYTGTESVTAIPADVVDWVLVELRQAATPDQALPATALPGWPKAYLLKSDGTIVDVNGTSPGIGNPVITSNLYAIIRHRNHIDIMSANALTLTGNSYSYNFTTAISQAWGGSAGYREIVPGVFGMVSGDTDKDGDITVLDFSKWATDFGQTLIYSPSDIDEDGEVTVLDFSKWATNFGVGNIAPLKSLNLKGTNSKYRSQVPGNQ